MKTYWLMIVGKNGDRHLVPKLDSEPVPIFPALK
jgi:hypothetical protein